MTTQNIAEKLWEKGRKEGLREGRDEGKQAHARATLRRILAVRQLAPTRTDEARIARCDDLGTLDRWIGQALTAQTLAEALRVRPVTAKETTEPPARPAPAPRRRRAARVS